MRANVFPSGVSHIKRLLKKTVVERQGVCVISQMSHSNAFYKWLTRDSTGFYRGFGLFNVSQNELLKPLPLLSGC